MTPGRLHPIFLYAAMATVIAGISLLAGCKPQRCATFKPADVVVFKSSPEGMRFVVASEPTEFMRDRCTVSLIDPVTLKQLWTPTDLVEKAPSR